MKIILGDQSPWNGGLERARVFSAAGHDVVYQQHDADMFGVSKGVEKGTSINFGNPPYYSLACRLPFGFVGTGAVKDMALHTRLQAVLQSCRKAVSVETKQRQDVASVHPVVYLCSSLEYTIGSERVGCLSEHQVSAQSAIEQLFKAERLHSECLSGIDLPHVTSMSEALGLYSHGYPVDSLTDMFHEEPPCLLSSLGPEHFWHISHERKRLVYDPSQSDHYAVVPRGPALLIELMMRNGGNMALGYSNCAYKDKVVALRNTCARQVKMKAFKVVFNWRPSVFDTESPFSKAWRKKGEPDFKDVFDYWARRPTSMGLRAFGGELNAHIEEENW